MQMLLYPFLQVCKIVKISCQCLRQLLTLPLNVTASPKVLCWQGCPMQIGVSVGTEERRIKDHHPYLQFCLEQIKSMQSPCSKKLPRIRLKPTKQLVVGEQITPHTLLLTPACKRRRHPSAALVPIPLSSLWTVRAILARWSLLCKPPLVTYPCWDVLKF